MPSTKDEYLTVAEVAHMLRLSQATIRNWLDEGRLPAVRIGRRVRITRADLNQLLERGYKPDADRDAAATAEDFWSGEPVPANSADGLTGLLDHAQGLLRAVTDHVGAWRDHGPPFADNDANILINVFFARSTRTYEAIVEHLGNRGFAEQGAMLNRSLFEDMVDGRWVSLNPDLAATRLRQHYRSSEDLRLIVARDFPEFFDQDSLDAFELEPPMTEKERAELNGIFGRYGQGSWTGLSLHERFAEVAGTWAEGLARRQAEFFFRWLHRLNNETLHPSAHSLARLGAPQRVADELHFRLGSTEDLLADVLFFAFWTYSETAHRLNETFSLDGSDELYASVIVPGLAAFGDASQTRRDAAKQS